MSLSEAETRSVAVTAVAFEARRHPNPAGSVITDEPEWRSRPRSPVSASSAPRVTATRWQVREVSAGTADDCRVGRAISFGPFRLLPEQLLLLEADRPVRLGSRALGILLALVERPGELVGKDELMGRVWPGTFVEEGNLKAQVAGLRRALGDGHGGNRYLATIPGRGYCFVAPVTLTKGQAPLAPQPARAKPEHNLPVQVTRLIGRLDVVAHVAAQLAWQRFLTIVGPGGIGKTAIALAAAERLLGRYEHGVWFVDLAPLVDPRLVPNALASALGLEIRSEDPLPGMTGALRDKRLLLVLDNCEHVIDAAAALAGGIVKGVPGVHILATSREPLRADGEHVHRVSSLESPPASDRLSAAEALGFPAVQLFVERAAATLDGFELSDADAPIVAEICRALDGLPLAIEFATARVDALGVRGIAARLGDRLRLLTGGRRTALPRQRSMSATFDWSYGLLAEVGRATLRRLGIFAGSFTLRAAGAVAADARHPEGEIVAQVTELTSKSLVVADLTGAEPRFRLLDTTRAYALEKLEESGERDRLGRCHAEYYRDLLEAAAQDEAAADGWPATYGPEIDNLRAALRWAFAAGGDTAIGVALAIAAEPLWLEMSLVSECKGWAKEAVANLDVAERGTRASRASGACPISRFSIDGDASPSRTSIATASSWAAAGTR